MLHASSAQPAITLDEVARLQAEYHADDLVVTDAMLFWSRDALVAYFESGGEARPPERPAAGITPATPLGRKARLLCLHGTAANASIMRIQCGRLFSQLKAEVQVAEGGLVCEEGNAQLQMMRKYFGQAQVYREYARPRTDDRGWRTYEAAAERLAALEVTLQQQSPPPDALLGFSQGANFATMLAARAEQGSDGALPPFRCVVLLAPSDPGWVRQLPILFNAPLVVPALIVAGDKDTVAGEGAATCAKLFRSARIIRHSEGHRPVPSQPVDMQAVITAVRDFLDEHLK